MEEQNQKLEIRNKNLLPLDEPRVIAICGAGGEVKYRHRLRAITAEMWERCFQRFALEEQSATVRTEDGNVEGTGHLVDIETALLWLWEQAVEAVEGYRLTDGRALGELEGWKRRVPRAHRREVADKLIAARPADAAPEAIHPELEEVILESVWSSAPDGTLPVYAHLVHRFAPPTAAQEKRYRRETTQAVAVGGSRGGRVIRRARQSVLAGLYDELVREVEGYSVGGRALEGDEIARWMDGWHKAAAVGALF